MDIQLTCKQYIKISIKQQRLDLFQEQIKLFSYAVSTAIKGIGEEEGSEQTPKGAHYIRAKIGAGLPINAVLVGRRFSGEIYTKQLANEFPKRDWVLTRVLWLCGMERGINRMGVVDSMRRYIYIHGTPDTEPMGLPKSHGCIRMRNNEIIELFDKVNMCCHIMIEE